MLSKGGQWRGGAHALTGELPKDEEAPDELGEDLVPHLRSIMTHLRLQHNLTQPQKRDRASMMRNGLVLKPLRAGDMGYEGSPCRRTPGCAQTRTAGGGAT